MFEKVSENSLIPVGDLMDDANTQRSNPFLYFYFSFAFEDEEFFFFISGILYSVWIIDIGFSFFYKEEVESTIDRERKHKSSRKHSEDGNRYKGEKFSEDSRKGHHRDKYDDSCHHS